MIDNKITTEYIFIENMLKLDDYIRLKEEAFGGDCHRETAKASLNGSLYVLHAEVDSEVIGMARIIGDGGFVNYLADMIIVPAFQARGIGCAIMERMIAFIKSNIPEGGRSMIALTVAKGKEGFYEKFGFKILPDETNGHGMRLRLKG